MIQLAAVILTKNEARHITACIASLQGWTDAIVLWDSGSTDATCTIAQKLGAVVIQRPFDNYAAQRQAALDTVNAEWILFVDADERATPALAAEIRHRLDTIRPEQTLAGIWIPRRNVIVGREIRAGGFWPDYQLRLLRRGAAHYVADREVHEIVRVEGKEEQLVEPLVHYNYADWPQFHRKQQAYARYEARILAARGIGPRPHNFIVQPFREWRRRYLTLCGWRDGLRGFQLALLLAWYYGFTPYWLLWTEKNTEKIHREDT